MLHGIKVDASLWGERKHLRFFAGESLHFTVVKRPAGTQVVVTVAADHLSEPLIEVEGTDEIELNGALLAALPEGQTGQYNVWLRDGAELSLLLHGDIRPQGSIQPMGSVEPLAITGTPPGTAEVGTVYVFAPNVSGGVPPYAFALSAGSLPAGLTLDPASGAIGGTPTAAGEATGLVLQVTDAAGDSAALPAFAISVEGAGEAPLPQPDGLLSAGVAGFTEMAGWTSEPAASYGGGSVTIDGSQGSGLVLSHALEAPMVSGQAYAAYLDVRSQSAGNVGPRVLGDGFLDPGPASLAPRHVMRWLTAAGDYTRYGFATSADFAGEVREAQIYPLQAALDGPLDIYVLAGQSNMVGASATTGHDPAIDLPERRVLAVSCLDAPIQGYETDGSGGSIHAALSSGHGLGRPIPLTHPVVHASPHAGGVSPAGGIATRLAEEGTAPGRTPVLVCAAAGGTDLFDVWNPEDDGRHHALMVANVAALLSRNAGNAVKGMFWCQGESSAAPGYAALLASIVGGLRANWGEFPLVIMEHGGTRGETGFENMRAEQMKLATGSGAAEELVRCAYVERPAGAALEADGVHYTGTTNRLRGDEAGAAMVALF